MSIGKEEHSLKGGGGRRGGEERRRMKEKEIGHLKVNKLGSELLRGLRHKTGLIFTLSIESMFLLLLFSCPVVSDSL